MSAAPLRVELLEDGRLLRLCLDRPKANIVDAEMITALQGALDRHAAMPRLAAVLLQAAGPNFSFGASVEEHLPGNCRSMLQSLHRLIMTLVGFPLPVLVAVRGHCLGGGMELASAGNLLFAASGARFGQPEIQLGVFAPAASCLLPERIGCAAAEDLLMSGRVIDAAEGSRLGLVTALHDDPEGAALDYFRRELQSKSAFALRHAMWAARHDLVLRVQAKLAAVERRYLDELMAGHDPAEGLTAFLEKRPPAWIHR